MSCDNNPDHQHFWSHQCANLVSLLSANAAQASNFDVMGSVLKPLLIAPPPNVPWVQPKMRQKNPMMKGAQLWRGVNLKKKQENRGLKGPDYGWGRIKRRWGMFVGHVVPTFLWLFICLWF